MTPIPLACRTSTMTGDARRLRERLRFLARASLLVVDEIGYLPVVAGAGNLFFQLVNARYDKGAMILTSNRGFAEWARYSAIRSWPPHCSTSCRTMPSSSEIEGSSYRLRQLAALLPERFA
jgi:DNA replication protein DnaC